MTIRDFPIFADENIFRALVEYLRNEGLDVKYVREEPLIGSKDTTLIPIATSEGRVIITQDGDFGQIVFTQQVDFIGIIYLRPGHYPPAVHIQTFKVLLEQNLEVSPPFIISAENKENSIRIRLRNMPK
ncbi:MAG: DUF5615 family PIN-like protein [Saprospiraceae bacterium]|nr:DUF5615 family PIN-like protein [Saprospiraceae bacterium]